MPHSSVERLPKAIHLNLTLALGLQILLLYTFLMVQMILLYTIGLRSLVHPD